MAVTQKVILKRGDDVLSWFTADPKYAHVLMCCATKNKGGYVGYLRTLPGIEGPAYGVSSVSGLL